MRKLHDHIVSRDQALQLEVVVRDEPGHGGACHEYDIIGKFPNSAKVPLRKLTDIETDREGNVTGTLCHVSFQDGPIGEFGVNGITEQAMLAIIIDRLRSFQLGPYSCRENAIALTHIETGLMWLHKRTLERMQRGVEGTNQK